MLVIYVGSWKLRVWLQRGIGNKKFWSQNLVHFGICIPAWVLAQQPKEFKVLHQNFI